MITFIARRLLLMIPTTLGIALVVFGLYHAAPGDPATVMMGMGSGQMATDSDAEARTDAFRREHGLDRSLAVQFFNYIGPFNLMRDGHPWFSSPYTERKVKEVPLADGSDAREGRVLEIEHPPGLDPAEIERLDGLVARLVDEGLAPSEHDAASAQLVEAGDDALAPLLTALWKVRASVDRNGPAIERVTTTLERVAGEQPAVADERREELGALAEIRSWFAWYYDRGGTVVRNTGAQPWGGLLAFDLGREMQSNRSVMVELGQRLKWTVPLSLAAVLLTYIVAIPLGIFSVRRQGSIIDNASTIGLFVLYSIPQFWAGLMLILIFGVTGLSLLPVIGVTSSDFDQMSSLGKAWDIVLHCILPVLTLAYGGLAYISRQMRAGMLDVIRQDYIRTARAKGLADNVVVYKHALRNSVIPIITLFASILPILIGGSIIVEKVFNIPGMGNYAFQGLLNRDFYIIMATTIFVGIMTQIGILLSDITYSLVDPRIRHD